MMGKVNTPSLQDKSVIEHKTLKILALNPSAVARLRLLRDVMMVGINDKEIQTLKRLIDQSKHIQLLERKQGLDGGWGAFHSASPATNGKIVTTEKAIERAIYLGLQQDHCILTRAKEYIIEILESKRPFPDRAEKNDRWQTGVRLFLTATLAMIDPSNDILEQDRSLWREVAIKTFRSGVYREGDEIEAHLSLTGASVEDSYLRINNRYALALLGSKEGLLPAMIELALLTWIWNHHQGIGYLSVPLAKNPPLSKSGPFDRWLTSLELLLRFFPRSAHFTTDKIQWLWQKQDEDGLWDFGPCSRSSPCLPFADDWRTRHQRKVDWSTRILLLAARHKRLTNC